MLANKLNVSRISRANTDECDLRSWICHNVPQEFRCIPEDRDVLVTISTVSLRGIIIATAQDVQPPSQFSTDDRIAPTHTHSTYAEQ